MEDEVHVPNGICHLVVNSEESISNSTNPEDVDDSIDELSPEREVTQTDHLNKSLLDSFLRRLNQPGAGFPPNFAQNQDHVASDLDADGNPVEGNNTESSEESDTEKNCEEAPLN